MALSEYLHEMPRNRIICRKKANNCAKKVLTRFYIIINRKPDLSPAIALFNKQTFF